jgi:aryl-alcohol dehydrogenase-like predicted oxidoreductase
MIYTNLSNTNIKVSKICLGTMTWGNQNTEDEAHQQMDYAFEKGVNFFDTAELYPIPAHPDRRSITEKIIGSWFKKTGNRDKTVLASKIVGKAPFTEFMRTTGFSKASIIEAIEGSLKRLQTDYIDLYQLHWPERNTNYFGKRGYQHNENDPWQDNFHEVLHTLGDFVKQGKIRHVGVSNETPWGIMRYLEEYKMNDGLPRMVSIQNPYSLLNRQFEVGLAEIALRENLKLLAYSPLGFGALSGKYLGDKLPKNSRLALFPNYNRYIKGNSSEATQKYFDLAQDHNLSLTQMALSFVNSRPFLTSNIIGATTIEQLKENITSIDINLNSEVLKGIEEIHNDIPNPAP